MRERLRRAWDRIAPETGRWVFVVFLVLFVLLAWDLLGSKKPWDTKTLERIADREARGKFWQIRDYVTVWFWYAAALGEFIILGVLLSARWWGKKASENLEEAAGKSERGGRAFWIGFAIVLLVAFVFRVPRLGHSFWNDEEYAYRTYVWGELTVDDGEWKREKPEWLETVFKNKLNNHIFASVVARASAEAGALFTGPSVNEAAVRLFPMLAAIGGIAILMAWMRSRGSPWEGLAVGFVFSLMPWHIRYSVEMRGYAWLLLFVPLGWWVASVAWRSNRWPAWIMYAGVQVLAFLSSPGIAYVLVVANTVLLLLSLRREGMFRRFLVANILAAIVALEIIAPSIPQARKYLTEDEDFVGHHLGMGWLADLWTHIWFGAPWMADPIGIEAGAAVSPIPGAWLVLAIVLPIFVLLGLFFWFKANRPIFAGAAATLGGGLLLIAWTMAKDGYMHSWYVMFILVPLGVLAVGGGAFLARLTPSRAGGAAPIVSAILLLMAFAAITHKLRAAIAFHERQPIRGAVVSVHGGQVKPVADVLTASMGTSRRQILSYDPHCLPLKSESDLREFLTVGATRGGKIAIYVCGETTIPEGSADQRMLAILKEQGFKAEEPLKGLEAMFSYTVFVSR